jgi:putative colanic acid biosynthesis UDP-glucose lipid carrier transferase
VAQVIVLAIPTHRLAGRLLIETCQEKGCRLLIYSNLSEILQHPLSLVREDGLTFYSLQDEPLEDPFNRVLKRSFDLALALPVVLGILPPLCLAVWLVQRLQAPGALFFVQERAGRNGRRFNLFKFRSMYEARRDPATEAVQAKPNDSRVYGFGRFIRRTSLDEFPQFFNVLRGDMSIVGPRPHMLAHDEQFSRFYKAYRTRHFTKPGITGLAQIRGLRGEITDPRLLQERVENDLFYIANWSIWLDLQITVKTLWHVFRAPKTAY